MISVTGWAYGARIKRAQIITLRTRDYITAAKFAGRLDRADHRPGDPAEHDRRWSSSASWAPALGAIGARGRAWRSSGSATRTTTSWGTMLNQASIGGAMLTGQWAWLVAPGLASGRC